MALFWCQPHLNEERVPQILRILPLCQQKLWAFFPLGDCELSILALSDNIREGKLYVQQTRWSIARRHTGTARPDIYVRYGTTLLANAGTCGDDPLHIYH